MKNFKCILIAALLGSISCQHEEIKVSGLDVTFVARSESGTRTSLVMDQVLWDEGDQINILWEGGSVMSEALVGFL